MSKLSTPLPRLKRPGSRSVVMMAWRYPSGRMKGWYVTNPSSVAGGVTTPHDAGDESGVKFENVPTELAMAYPPCSIGATGTGASAHAENASAAKKDVVMDWVRRECIILGNSVEGERPTCLAGRESQ